MRQTKLTTPHLVVFAGFTLWCVILGLSIWGQVQLTKMTNLLLIMFCRDSSYADRTDASSHPVVRDLRSPDMVTGAMDEVDNSTPGRVRRNRSCVECSDTLSHPVVHDFRFPDLVPGATDEGMVLVGSLPVVDRPTVEDVAPSVVVVSGAHSTDTPGNSYSAAESLRTSNVSDVLVPGATDEGVLMAGLPTTVVRPTPVDDAATGDNTESGDPIHGDRFTSASASFGSGGRR